MKVATRRRVIAGAVAVSAVLIAACGSNPVVSPVSSTVGSTGSATPAASSSTAASASASSAASTSQADGSAPAASPLSTSSRPAARPVGLIAVQEFEPGHLDVFTSAVFDDPSIAGVAPRVNWKDLEPSADQFNWQVTDQVFAQAAASHKFVVLTVVPGFGTPAWALQGVATATFARQYGPEAGQVGALPMPWDQTYLSRWFAFLQAVADRYGTSPEFRMIAAAGPTSVSEEMSLPDDGSDIHRWIALGYTPDKYAGAWRAVFQAYLRIFPSQYVSLALYPGLAISNNRTRDASQRSATTQSIVAAGLQYKDRFALQGNGLVASSNGDNVYDVVSANRGNVVTGFELTTSATINPGREGDAASPVHALALALQHGLAAHVDFLEVYQADVMNPATQSVLQTTEAELPH